MVANIFLTSKIIKTTIESYMYFLRHEGDYDKDRDVYRQDVFDFINDLLDRNVSPFGADFQAVIADLNKIFVAKVQEEQRQQKTSTPSQNVPLNLSELTEYLKQRADDKRLVSQLRADQKRWLDAQKKNQVLYIKPKKLNEPVALNKQTAQKLSFMAAAAKSSSEESIVSLKNNFTSDGVKNLLAQNYTSQMVEDIAPILAMDFTLKLTTLDKKLGNVDQETRTRLVSQAHTPVNADSLALYAAALSGNKESNALGQGILITNAAYHDIVAATYGEEIATKFYPKGRQDFELTDEAEPTTLSFNPVIFESSANEFAQRRELFKSMDQGDETVAYSALGGYFQSSYTKIYNKKADFTSVKPKDEVAGAFAVLGQGAQIAKLFGLPDLSIVRAAAILNKGEILVGTQGVSFIANLSVGTLQLSVFPTVAATFTPVIAGTAEVGAATAITGAAAEIGVGVATKEAGSVTVGAVAKKTAGGVAAKVIGFVGGIGGPVGAVLTWVVAEVGVRVVKTIGTGLRKRGGAFIATGAGFLVGVAAGPVAGLLVFALLGFLAGINWRRWSRRVAILGSIIVAGWISVAVAAMITMLSLLIGGTIVVSLIIFIINAGAYVVPGSSGITATPPPGFTTPVRCTTEAVPLSFPNSSSSSVASRGWEIINNMLQGFWCYWNRSPDYPELFNEQVYAQNPNPPYPGPIQGCPNCMFWCTWLIIKSYQESGSTIPFTGRDVGVGTMENTFRGQGKFISPGEATPQNIVPGSAVFFGTSHVALVYSVSQDAIVFVQSNGPTKSGSLTFNANGQGVQNLGDLPAIAGFGLP